MESNLTFSPKAILNNAIIINASINNDLFSSILLIRAIINLPSKNVISILFPEYI